MSVYSYKAIPLSGGKSVTGTIDADSRVEALRTLAHEYQVTRLEGVQNKTIASSKQIQEAKKITHSLLLKRKVKKETLAMFCHQMATMIKAGILPQVALNILTNQARGTTFSYILSDIATDVERGNVLSAAMKKHPQVFSASFVAMVEAGETSGKLDDAFARSAASFERDDTLTKDLRSAMVYPVIILFMAVTVVAAIILYAIPKFEVALKSFEAKIPPTMIMLQNIGIIIRQYWYLLPLLLIGVYIAAKMLLAIPIVRFKVHQYMLRVPRIKKINIALIASRFCRSLGSLMDAGVPVVVAVSYTADTIGNEYARKKIQEIQNKIEQASALSEEVRLTGIFPEMVSQMIAIGEETGEVENLLNTIADSYEKEVERTIKTLKTAIEPILLLFIGGIVATIVLMIVRVYADAILSVGVF